MEIWDHFHFINLLGLRIIYKNEPKLISFKLE